MKILFISAEVAPFAKRGGLADVAGALPKALHDLGHDVRVVMPAYAHIEAGYRFGRYDFATFPFALNVPMGNGQSLPAGAFQGTLPDSDVPIYFIAQHDLLGRPEIYGYDDDAYRFAFFSRAALDLAIGALNWQPDIVHAHDWHTAPAITWLATAGQGDARYRDIKTVFTIHNLAHQGRTDWHIFNYLGLQTHALFEEPYGGVNFMARGIYHATKVNTVSPTYAQEIMTYDGGAGLDGLLRHRGADVSGILNGLDFDVWNTATDPNLAQNFSLDTFHQRRENKRALQQELGLPERNNVPLIAIITRLDWQKGLDLMGEVVHRLMNNVASEAQFILLGSGEYHYENMFAQMAAYHQDKMRVILEYRADLAPRIYAGSDMFLMPSLFEPCGLGQLIAMRYGSVPVVRATGGLVDTVQDGETGFVFTEFNIEAFWATLAQAMDSYYNEPEIWSQIQMNGYQQDFSWPRRAKEYVALYESALK